VKAAIGRDTAQPVDGVRRRQTGGTAMRKSKEIELDCSKNCKSVVKTCETSGRSRDECENRYNDCVSRCTFA
jgi:hypothetical protein